MDIFKYSEISTILKHYIGSLPKNGRGEITRIAASLRVSTTLVSQVLSGDRTFTPEQTQMLGTYLGLSGLEADYIAFLVQRDRAGSTDLKKFWQQKIESLREQSLKVVNRVKVDRILNAEEKSIFYSSPLYSAIRLFASVGTKGKSLDEIAERFELSRAKTVDMLKFLVEAGLCELKNDRYFLGLQKTHLEEGSPHLPRHHANWRLSAMNRSQDLEKTELMYTAPVSLSKKDFDILREDMVVFIKKFLEKVHASPAEEIACLNIDFFWIKK